MTAPIGGSFGRAFIEFEASTRKVGPDLERGLVKAGRDADKVAHQVGKELGDRIAEGAEDELSHPRTGGRIGRAIQRAVRGSRTKVTVDVEADVDRGSIRRFSRTVSDAFGEGFTRAFGGVGGLLTSLGSSIGNVGSRGPFGAIIGALIVFGIPAIVGAVAALLAVFYPLINVLYLLPGALATVVASIAPVIVAFQGFGEALGAIMEGDPKKIEEALKGLSKSARDVAKDFQAVLPWLRQFQDMVQEQFFFQLTDAIPRLKDALGPTFLVGFQLVAEAAGRFAAGLIRVAENPSVKAFFEQLFRSTANVFDQISPGFNRFLVGLADLGLVSLPRIESLADTIGQLLFRFGEWLTRISENGTFNELMDSLSLALSDLKELALSGWNLVKAIIGGAEEEDRARGFLDALNGTIRTLTEFFESETGKKAIQGMITLGEIFLYLLLSIVVAWATIGYGIRAVGEFIKWVIGLVRDLIGWLGRAIERLGRIGIPSWARGFIPGLAEGGIVDRPTLAWLGEKSKREVVLPMDDPARARQLANESGLMSILGNGNGGGIIFGANSIQVNFMGSTIPTQEQAYQTGTAVGRGIQDQLAHRNTRLAVRTL